MVRSAGRPCCHLALGLHKALSGQILSPETSGLDLDSSTLGRMTQQDTHTEHGYS